MVLDLDSVRFLAGFGWICQLVTAVMPSCYLSRTLVTPQVLLHAYHVALSNPALLPLRASRALGLSLSDLALRSWPAQPAAQFDAAARSTAFSSVAAPLAQLLQAAAASPSAAPAGLVQQAATVATTVVQSYAGSPKPLRSIVAGSLVSPALPAAVELVRAERARGDSKAAAALLRLVTCSLEVLPTELGSDTVEQLLGALVQAFAAAGKLADCYVLWGRCGVSVAQPLRPQASLPTTPT